MNKKSLLSSGLLLVSAMAFANVTEPQEFDGLCLTAISSNGVWATSSDELLQVFTIVNLETGERYMYTSANSKEIYSGGDTKNVSDNGIVVASGIHSDLGYYWKDGVWRDIPMRSTDVGAIPKAITPDGSRIVGNVMRGVLSADETSIMSVPVIWYANEDGSYSEYVELPYPTVDFSGRTPQYILADDIAADGKVASGMLVDYQGFTVEPLVFLQNGEGEWTYQFVHHELINPDEVVFPEFPGEGPDPVDPKDFMTPEEQLAYQNAIDAYFNRVMPNWEDYATVEEVAAYYNAYNNFLKDPENNPCPSIEEYMSAEGYQNYMDALDAYNSVDYPEYQAFMTPEEVEAYDIAYAAWENESAEWQVKIDAFEEAFLQVFGNVDVPTFQRLSDRLSPNGKYLVVDAVVLVEDENEWSGYAGVGVPFVFDLETNDYYRLDQGVADVYATAVSDNGEVLGATPVESKSRNMVIAKGFDQPFVLMEDVIKEQNNDLFKWVREHCYNTVTEVEYIFDPISDNYKEVVTTEDRMQLGTPVASADFKTIASWVYKNWIDGADNFFTSYVIPFDVTGSVYRLFDSSLAMKSVKRGVLEFDGNVASVEVYDLAGNKVFAADVNANSVNTGLTRGVYIVNVKDADSKTSVYKVTF